MSDGSRVSRAIQGSFSTVNIDESSKFGGELAEAPAWDMWTKRYSSIMNSSFEYLPPERQVILSRVPLRRLAGDAQRFFYVSISPRLGRSAPDLVTARAPKGTGADVYGRNDLTLSVFYRLLDSNVCTREARNVLRQELVSLNLSGVQKESGYDRSDALRLLKRRIDRLSANGPVIRNSSRIPLRDVQDRRLY